MLEAEKKALIEIAETFVQQICSNEIVSCILFGSVAKGDMGKDSDIDVFVITKKPDKRLERGT